MLPSRGICPLLLLLSTFALPAIARPTPQETMASPVRQASISELTISPGDLLHLAMLGAPEFDHDTRVSASGKVSLPLAGEVKVAGLSIAEAEHVIADQLEKAGMFVAPEVSLSIKEYATVGISVLGEVQKPGIYLLIGEHTLFDAISAAGGLTPKAGRFVAISHRGQPDKAETVAVRNGPDGNVTGNVSLAPGDTLVISKAGIVYVVGDVKQPAGIVMENPELTVLQAIAVAQGTNANAALGNARLLRKGPNGVQEIPIPLNQILAAKAPDVQLQPDDVLFVPTSMAKSATKRSLEAILQTVTGVVIYRR